jgi:hypothetical protein
VPDAPPPPLALSPTDPQSVSRLRTALIRALRVSPDARDALCDALELLEGIQQQLDDYHRTLPPPPEQPAPPRHRPKSPQQYQLERTAEGEFLTEHRPGHSQPFRCPRSTYDTAAQLLANAEQPLHFDEFAEQLNTRLGSRQPDYRLRVALRFWLRHKLVDRTRSKYRPADPNTFLHQSADLWQSLARPAE